MNGDGFVFKFDFSEGQDVHLTTRIMRPPDFYADLATRYDGPASKEERFAHYGFKNLGISRMSFHLGSRNFLNTAFQPLQFKGDSGTAILTTDDIGRPYLADPETLELITPIGQNSDWISSMPKMLKMPFPLIETTAHPSWDPLTKELFTVNFIKSMKTDMGKSYLGKLLMTGNHAFRDKMADIAKRFEDHGSEERAIREIKRAIATRQAGQNPILKFLGFIWHLILSLFGFIFTLFSKLTGSYLPDRVYLMRFDAPNSMKRWKLVDEKGKDLVIRQCMHQTFLTRNYIILMDSSFKFAFDLMFNNPFPGNTHIEKFIRKLGTKTMEPYTNMWIVPRDRLKEDSDTVQVITMKDPVPYECIHFSAEFEDDEGITLYTIHNNTLCLAEWIREYDESAYEGEVIPEELIGCFAVCPLAVGRTAKLVVNPDTGTFTSTDIIREEGNLPPVDELDDKPIGDIGPNSWGLGIMTFRDHYSADTPNYTIGDIYYTSTGANKNFLTKYILGLYEDYPWREIPLDDMLKYIEKGIPHCVFRVDSSNMKIEDYWQFKDNEYLFSVQFMQNHTSHATLPPSRDGYLLLTVKVSSEVTGGTNYSSQVWLFEAWNLKGGPVCKLEHDDFEFASTLHSCFLPSTGKTEVHNTIDIRKDYTQSIHDLFGTTGEKQQEMMAFFNRYVFPHYDSEGAETE
jgi:carotenoid cleavage dioxygenase-like enzyme